MVRLAARQPDRVAVRKTEGKDGRQIQKMMHQLDINYSKMTILSTIAKLQKEEAKQVVLTT